MTTLEPYLDPIYEYLTSCGAVPPMDGATIRLDGSLVVNLTDLHGYSPEAVDALTQRPDEAVKELTSYARELLKVRIPEVLRDHPLEIQLVGHPEETPLRLIRSHMIGRFVSTAGIVVKITQTEPKLTSASYICGVCERRTMVPQRLQYREEPRGKCEECDNRAQWILDPTHSVYEDVQLLKLQEAPESLPSGQMPRTFTYELRGLLCGRVNAGDRVRLNAVVDAAMSGKGSPERKLEMYGRCLGVEQLAEDAEDLECTTEEAKAFSEMARQRDMFQAVADSIAPSIYGMHEEKKCTASLLMGGVPKELEDIRVRGDINVLFCGDPGTSKSQFLRFAVKAAPRGMYATGRGSTEAGLTAAVVKDKDIGYSLEAGALVISDKGICAVDEIDKMNENDRRAIHPALEQQVVPINKAGINTTLNARCGVLAAANPKDGRYNPYLTVVQNINLEATLLNRFDLIRIVKDTPNVERDTALVAHLVKVHNMEQIEAPLSLKTLRKYIAYCRKHFQPEIPSEVSQQLMDYYLSLRKASEGDAGDPKQPTIMITPRQFESCIRVTEAVARARLHEVATEDDALTALGIIESSMEQVGVDPSTGERNIDSWMTGKPRGQREKIELLRNTIWEMQNEAPDGYCDYQQLLQKTTEKGLFRVAELRKLVDTLKEQDAWEPVTGKLKVVKPSEASPRQGSLQAKLRQVLEKVGEMAGTSGVRNEDLYAELDRMDIGRSEAAKLIGTLMKEGNLYSPRPSWYRRT